MKNFRIWMVMIQIMGIVSFGYCGGWEMSDIKSENPLIDGYFVDSKAGWVVGFNGTIFATIDGGNSWQKQESGLTGYAQGLYTVWFTDSNTGWTGGCNGNPEIKEKVHLLKTIDGGKTWTHQPVEGIDNINQIQFTDRDNGWIFSGTNLLWKTEDGCSSWSRIVLPFQMYPGRMFFVNKTKGWIAGREGNILCTDDGGNNWKKQDADTKYNLSDLFFLNEKIGWIIGGGNLFHTSDGGERWSKQVIDSEVRLIRVFFTDEKTGWISGTVEVPPEQGNFLRPPIFIFETKDGGVKWEKQQIGSGNINRLLFLNRNIGFAIGEVGTGKQGMVFIYN